MREEKEYYTYIMTNMRNNVLYIGVTNDLVRRIFEHKNKLNQGFTNKYNINKLVYYEEFNYVEDAIFREKQLKNWRRQWKIDLVRQENPKWKDLSDGWYGPSSCHPEPACPVYPDCRTNKMLGRRDSGSHCANEMPDQVRHDKKRDDKKIKLGRFGEKIAAEYLIKKGYEIVTQNYHTRDGEIDLICQKDKIINFIEVKTRTNQTFGWPEEAVTDEKLEKISLAAAKYLVENKINSEWQIDIISINLNQATKTAKIKHCKNISTDY